MAKSFPIRTNPRRFDPQGPLAFPSPVIVRDGKVMTRGENDTNPVMVSKFGFDCCCGDGTLPCDDCCLQRLNPEFECCEPSSAGDQSNDYTLTNFFMYLETPFGSDHAGVLNVLTQTAPVNFPNECKPFFEREIDLPLHALQVRVDKDGNEFFRCEGDDTAKWTWVRGTDCGGHGCDGARPSPPLQSGSQEDCIRSTVVNFLNFECGDDPFCTRGCFLLRHPEIDTQLWCFQYDESWTNDDDDGCHLHHFAMSFTITSNVAPCNRLCLRCR